MGWDNRDFQAWYRAVKNSANSVSKQGIYFRNELQHSWNIIDSEQLHDTLSHGYRISVSYDGVHFGESLDLCVDAVVDERSVTITLKVGVFTTL